MTKEEYEDKIRQMFMDESSSINAQAATLVSQTKPDARLISRTMLYIGKHRINRMLKEFPEALSSIKWAKPYPDLDFPPDDNQAVLDYFGIKFG